MSGIAKPALTMFQVLNSLGLVLDCDCECESSPSSYHTVDSEANHHSSDSYYFAVVGGIVSITKHNSSI